MIEHKDAEQRNAVGATLLAVECPGTKNESFNALLFQVKYNPFPLGIVHYRILVN